MEFKRANEKDIDAVAALYDAACDALIEGEDSPGWEKGVYPMRQDAVQALTALGYSGTEALQAVKKVEITEGMDSEAVLKAALKHMF